MAAFDSEQPDWMIEVALPEDAQKIAELHSKSFRRTYVKPGDDEHNEKVINEATQFLTPERIQLRTELLAESFENPDTHFYRTAMRDDGQPIGLIYGSIEFDLARQQTVQEIAALYVDEGYIGAGVGKALVEEFIEWSDPNQPIELGVVKDNERAKRFYTKMGFRATGEARPPYYDFMEEIMMKRGEAMDTTEQEAQPIFTIETMKTTEIEEATEMRLQSWFDTYTNDELGVTREWIAVRNEQQRSRSKQASRNERFAEGMKKGTFNAWVAKSPTGEIIGSTTPYTDQDGHQHVGSIYVDKAWHGTGVGGKLMQKVVEWFDPTKPIELWVVTYNKRAKAFYEKWGFEEVPGTEKLYDEKMPEIMMIRKPEIEQVKKEQ